MISIMAGRDDKNRVCNIYVRMTIKIMTAENDRLRKLKNGRSCLRFLFRFCHTSCLYIYNASCLSMFCVVSFSFFSLGDLNMKPPSPPPIPVSVPLLSSLDLRHPPIISAFVCSECMSRFTTKRGTSFDDATTTASRGSVSFDGTGTGVSIGGGSLRGGAAAAAAGSGAGAGAGARAAGTENGDVVGGGLEGAGKKGDDDEVKKTET